MADIERIGRRGIVKDTQQGTDHVWIGRRGFQQEQVAAAVGGVVPPRSILRAVARGVTRAVK